MKAVSLLSGGKDSFLSLNIARMIGMDIVATITVIPEEDSYMFHYPNASIGSVVSKCLGLRNIVCGEDEFESIVGSFSGHFLVAGAIRSDYQKSKLEEMSFRHGLIPFFPLWRKDEEKIIDEFLSSGSTAIFVSVAAEGLDEKLLGQKIGEETIRTLKLARERHGVSLVGEGGEYETLVTCSPLEDCCISIKSASIVERGLQKNLVIEDFSVGPSENGKPLKDP
jgi:diphthine-ammonia ligase